MEKGLKQPSEYKLPCLGNWSSSKFPCQPQFLWRANPKPRRLTLGTWRKSGVDPALCGFGFFPSRHSERGEKSNLWRLERLETPVGLLSSGHSHLKGRCRSQPDWLGSLFCVWSYKCLKRMIHPQQLGAHLCYQITFQFAIWPQSTHLPHCLNSNPCWDPPLYYEFREEC